MRLALITLLFGTIVITDASSVSKNMNVTPQNVAPLPRLPRILRTTKTKEDDEERTIRIPIFENIFESISVQMALKNKETGVDKAFQLLKLDEVGENLLQNPQFTNWEKYVKMVKGKDADNAILSSLHYRYGDDGVSKLLTNAEKKPATKELATKLEAKRLNDWIHDNKFYTPDKVFENLKLNKVTDNMFDSPQLATFSKFVDMWNPRNSRHPTTVLKVFTTTYGDDVVLKMFLEKAKSPVATKLKNEMVKNWEVALEHPANVFTLLKLDKAGDNLFNSPLLKTWAQYLKTFNEESKYGKTTMIKTFSTSYGDEKLATMLEAAKKVPDTEQFAKNLQAAQFNQWMVEKKTPKDILSVLKLKTEDFNFFNEKNPMVDVWRAYNKAYGTKVDTSFAFQP